jgi:hypothetical protein
MHIRSAVARTEEILAGHLGKRLLKALVIDLRQS